MEGGKDLRLPFPVFGRKMDDHTPSPERLTGCPFIMGVMIDEVNGGGRLPGRFSFRPVHF